jgi:hypothetical protein
MGAQEYKHHCKMPCSAHERVLPLQIRRWELVRLCREQSGAREAPEPRLIARFCHGHLSSAISSRSVARSGSACHRKSRTFLFFALQQCDFAVFNQPLVSLSNVMELIVHWLAMGERDRFDTG